MNKIKFIIIFLFFSTSIFAQKAAIQTAYNYLRYDDLDKAKEAIDQAAINPSTNMMAKTWYYRGLIYHAIYESVKEPFKSLKPGSLDEAIKSYEKTKELDTKEEFKEDIDKRLNILSSQFLNLGVDDYKEKRYAEALNDFEKSLHITSTYKKETDTLAMYNAALAAEKSGNIEKAKKYYQDIINVNYGGPKIYAMLSAIQINSNDTVSALSTIKAGRLKFPSNADLTIAELNIYLSGGKDKEASGQIDQAIANDPQNANLYYAKGVLNDKLGNAESSRASYKKAIELKPDFFDANYNLGAILFNEGAELVNKANALPVSKQKEYDSMKAISDAKFKEAKPYFEKAYQLNPKDKPTLQNLRLVYTRLNEVEKANEIKKVIDSLK